MTIEKPKEEALKGGPEAALANLSESIEKKGFNFEVFFKRLEQFAQETGGLLSGLFKKIEDTFGLKQNEYEFFIPKQESGKEKKVSYSSLRDALNKNPNWETYVTRASGDFNVPSPLIFAIVRQESNFNATANSPFTSARGLAQAIDSTWNEFLRSPENKYFKKADRFDPEAAIYFVAWYARYLANAMGKKDIKQPDMKDIAIAYHSGLEGYRRWTKYQSTGNKDELLAFQKRPEANFNGKRWKSYEEEVTDYGNAVPQYSAMYQQQLIA